MAQKSAKKITIVGAGFVGSTTAYTLMISGLISELVLIDINKNKTEGEVMDLNHGIPFVTPVRVYAGDYADCTGSDIIIIAAGANQKPGESRINLLQRNTAIFKDIIEKIIKFNTSCILLIVTNPVDILTYIALKLSGFPANRVIGSGTVLDTARFRYLIANHAGVDARNVHAYIIGEHGDTEVAAWSLTSIAGITLEMYCQKCGICDNNVSRNDIYENVKNAAYNIIERKGATYYAVALAVRRIVEAIIRDENSILTVSSKIDNFYGINDVCLSLPTVVNKNGIERVIEVPLSTHEKDMLLESARSLRNILCSLTLDGKI